MCFEDLVKKITPTLKRITYKLNGHFSYFSDEDLYQEALVYLWQEFCKRNLEDKTDSYILQGCFFHLKNYLRKVKLRTDIVSLETVINDEGMPLEEKLSRDRPDYYFDNLDNKMLVEDMQNDGLTKKEKEVLSLCLEGLTVREIGKKLAVSHVRVVKVKKNLCKKLKKFLE